MTVLQWDKTGERTFETGVRQGVLYQLDDTGEYTPGVAWNGLTTVTESPGGAESNKQYADDQVYLNLLSAETFDGTIEAFTYPVEFEQNDGTASPTPGVTIGQQPRKTFGLCYRTIVGNDVDGNEYGYKLHLIWGALAAPSEKAFATVNDTPSPIGFSWGVSTTPVAVGTVLGVTYKPTSTMTISSIGTDPAKLATLEGYLYGTIADDPRLPSPADVIMIMAGTLTTATPTAPTYNASTDLITIPSVTGVEYYIDGALVPAGDFGPITSNKLVKAKPATGYKFPAEQQTQWGIIYS